MIRVYSKSLFALLFFLAFISLISLLNLQSAKAATRDIQILKEFYLDLMPSTPLPKDTRSDTSNYISLMNNPTSPPSPNEIPNVNTNSRLYYDKDPADKAFFKVYALPGSGSKQVTVDYTNRDVGEYACSGYKLIYKLYRITQAEDAFVGAPVKTGEVLAPGKSNCQQPRKFSVDFGLLSESTTPDHSYGTRGLKVGIVTLEMLPDDPSKLVSPTFKIDIDDSARIGFAGPVGGHNPRVAIYPSNLKNDHTVEIDFMPPCATPQSSERRLYWNGDDRGVTNGNQDRNSNFVNNINFSPPADPNTGRVPGAINGLTAQIIKRGSGSVGSVVQYSGNSQTGEYVFNSDKWALYTMRFSNVTGGNRIIFHLPFDTADASTGCAKSATREASENWELNNTTAVYQSGVLYNANHLRGTEFTHTVKNLDKSDDPATGGEHESRIQYTLRRGNGVTATNFTTGGNWSNSNTGAGGDWANKASGSTPTTRTLDPRESFTVRDGDSTDSKSRPRTDDIRYLTHNGANSRTLIVRGQSCTNGIGGANPTNCVGGVWAYGDAYCERTVTNRYKKENGVLTNLADISDAKCVELGAPVVCDPDPWGVGTEVNTDGPNALNDAWVGDTYTFNYNYWRTGDADQTESVTFWHNDKTGGQGSTRLGNRDFSFGVGPFTARDGGRTFSDSMIYNPSSGNYCGSNGPETTISAPSVYVPYYFDISPQVDGVPNSTEQGDSVDVQADYNLPVADDGGREHTWTEDTQYKITRIINPSSATVASQNNDDGNVCAYITPAEACGEILPQQRPADVADKISNGHIMPNASAWDPLGSSTILGSETETISVGKKLCFVVSLTSPTHEASPSWRHSDMRCTTIVKKPKVHFLNGDLTVGRSPAYGTCDASTVNNSAIIQTAAGSPASSGTGNSFGSWIEYGAFATSDITQFGSGAFTYRSADPASYKRLSFANTGSQPGGYRYGSPCLADAFSVVKDGKSNVISDDDAKALPPGDYFTHPDRDSRAEDKTGYVSNPGKSVVIGDPVAPTAGSIGDPDRPGLGGKTYTVKQCDSYTTTTPEGWAVVGGGWDLSHSSGCSGDGGSHRLKTHWAYNGIVGKDGSNGWRFTAPASTSLVSLSANYQQMLGTSEAYTDPFTYMDTNLGRIHECTGFIGCVSEAKPATWTLSDATWLQFGVFCSTNSGNPGPCHSYGSETSMGLGDMSITLKDTAAPTITVDSANSSLVPTDGSSAKGSATLKYAASDNGSGVYQYKLTAKSSEGSYDLGEGVIDTNGGKCNTASINNLVPCVSSTTKTIVVDTKTKLPLFGEYEFMLNVTDRAGNQAAPYKWTATVDNRARLGADYNAFKERNIVIWARKDPNRACSKTDPTVGGDLTINTDITYQTDGYEKISQLPRIMFLADCDIEISHNVKKVDAWLVAKKDIYTCSKSYMSKIKDGTYSYTDCSDQLVVNGAVQANRLFLMRTHGADLTLTNKANPAELFNLRPDQIVSSWAQGQNSGAMRTVFEQDLPPRY